MTCPSCSSRNVSLRLSLEPRCEQTGYDSAGDYLECRGCGTKGDLLDFLDGEDAEKLCREIGAA